MLARPFNIFRWVGIVCDFLCYQIYAQHCTYLTWPILTLPRYKWLSFLPKSSMNAILLSKYLLVYNFISLKYAIYLRLSSHCPARISRLIFYEHFVSLIQTLHSDFQFANVIFLAAKIVRCIIQGSLKHT